MSVRRMKHIVSDRKVQLIENMQEDTILKPLSVQSETKVSYYTEHFQIINRKSKRK